MVSLNSGGNNMQRAISDALSAHWKLLIFQGIVMIILGMFAFALPVAATIAVDVYVGCLLLVSGIVGLVAVFSTKNMPAFLWSLVTAALSVAVGALLIWKPVEGALSLTLLLTAFFIVEGVFQTVAALSHREVIPHSWGWLLASGIADLVLAAIIISGWPGTVDWTLGLLAGVSLLTSGLAIVMVAMSARRLAEDVRDVIGGR